MTWEEAARVAALFALDPVGTGGVALRAGAGPVRDAWLALLAPWLATGAPIRRVPLGIGDERLLGGLDLSLTLQAGRPVTARGVLAEADGGVVVLAMAERVALATAARISAAIDTGTVAGASARFGLVALDEGINDERTPAALHDRLAFHLDLDAISSREIAPVAFDTEGARERLPGVVCGEEIVDALCGAAASLGVDGVRAPLLALAVARAAAALDGRTDVAAEDAALAARLVLAPRATRLPANAQEAPAPEPEPEPEAEPEPETSDRPEAAPSGQGSADNKGALEDRVLEAATSAIPAGLLLALQAGAGGAGRRRDAGRFGQLRSGGARGRPAGVRRGPPGAGARLAVVETLRAAAPWQRLRGGGPASADGRIAVRPEDFCVVRHMPRDETTTIFVVDASGSSALNRLAEAKGAVELLLADCYIRRDRVAVIAFRGRGAELLLPPTRSLVRAKRGLAGLPGGGGTPLAAAIDAASALADAVRRRGETPTIVLLTDGRANVARDGTGGRPAAEADATASARHLAATGVACLLIDTSPRPQAQARALAATMRARYLPLPQANATALSGAVQATRERRA